MGTIALGRSQRLPVHSGRLPRQERISVGLIENHRLLRERLADVMERQRDLHVVASAALTPGGLDRLKAARPQVVVINVLADGTVCHDCVRGVRRGLPEARVVVMNVPATRDDVILLIEEGVSGLLLQEATVDEFLRTIRLVSGGTNVVPDPLVPLLFSGLAHPATPEQSPGSGESADPLTVREREVAQLVADGFHNQVIADHLAISLHTVKTHVHSILAKLGLQSRLQIAVHVHKHGR